MLSTKGQMNHLYLPSNWLKHSRRNISKWMMQQRVENLEFTIISNDCWGHQVYQELDLPYCTPFVGLFILAPCYLKLLQNLEGYLSTPLTFTETSRYEDSNYYHINRRRSNNKWYPIGLLKEEIEIHFLHYASQDEAKEKWERRLQRFFWQKDKIFVKFSKDYKLCTEEHIQAFDRLNFSNKVCFVPWNSPNLSSTIRIPHYVFNGLKMYQVCKKYFDVASWLNRRREPLEPVYKFAHKVIYWRY